MPEHPDPPSDAAAQTGGPGSSLADRIVGAALVVQVAHLCLKFAGLIQAKAATHYLETAEYEPILVVAFTGVIGTLFLIGEEVIGPTFLPVFMREFDDRGEPAAWSFASTVLSIQFLLLLVAVGLIMCFPDTVIAIFTEWTPADDATRYELLRRSLVFLAPSLIFLSIGSTTYMLLNGYKRFFLAAFGDASTKICVVIALILGMGVFGFGHRALLFGLLFGSAAKLLTHLAGMLREIRFVIPSLNLRSAALRTMGVLMVPLLAGIIFAKVRDNFNNIYILTRIDTGGLLMANDLGRKLFASIQWLVPYALQIALFPFLCELVDRNDRDKLGEVLTTSCRQLLAVFVAGAVLLAVLSEQVSAFIFLGGKAELQVVLWTGLSTACYILVLPAAAMECVLMQGYFANRKTLSVTVIGVLSSLLSIVISYVFIVLFHVQATQALVVVALGFVASRYVKSTVLALFLKRSVPMFPFSETAPFLARVGLLGVVVGAATWGVALGFERALPDGIAAAQLAVGTEGAAEAMAAISRLRILLKLVVSGVAGGLTFLVGAALFRLREPYDMIVWILRKVTEILGQLASRLQKLGAEKTHWAEKLARLANVLGRLTGFFLQLSERFATPG